MTEKDRERQINQRAQELRRDGCGADEALRRAEAEFEEWKQSRARRSPPQYTEEKMADDLLLSTVRRNLLEQQGYTPYCGAHNCRLHWPRTHFNGTQFACACGWRSSFEAEFIEEYNRRRSEREKATKNDLLNHAMRSRG